MQKGKAFTERPGAGERREGERKHRSSQRESNTKVKLRKLKEEDESVPFTAASPIFLLFSPLIHTQPAAYGRECPVRITQKTCGFLI